MAIFIYCAGAMVWLTATIAVYRAVCDEAGNDEAFGDFVCSLIFWPIILLAYAIAMGWFAGTDYARRVTERKQPTKLRAGMDNGLYD